MQRREFCKLMAAAAAANAIPMKGQAGSSAPAGFNKLHQTYEEFCALPDAERVFYALVDGRIVETKLNDANWSPTEWGEPGELPGGSWDGVSMQAPIGGLSGEGPYQANWDSLLNYDAPPSSASGRTGARSACPKRATGMRAPCTRRALPTTDSITRIMAIPRSLATRI
jgi:alpha-L-fucosidase